MCRLYHGTFVDCTNILFIKNFSNTLLNKLLPIGIIAAVIVSAAVLIINLELPESQVTTTNLSTPSAGFFDPITVVASSESPSNAPNVAIDKTSGTMYVVYITEESGIHNLYLKSSTDGGKTFSEPSRVNQKIGNVFLDGRVSPNIVVDDQGKIYVLWVKADDAPQLFMGVIRSLVFAYSDDGGKTFSPSIVIAENEKPSGKSFHTLDVSSDGKVYVAWLDSPATMTEDGAIVSDKSRESAVRFVRSVDGGQSFEPSVVVDTNPCPCCNVNILAESKDSVYVSWRKIFDNPNGMTIRDMVVAHSSDGGNSFSMPSKISDDRFVFDGCVHVGAPMVLDSKGNIHVVWYTGQEDAPGVYYAKSSDNAKTFSKPLAILTDSWVPPLRAQLTVDDNDTVWITWEDSTGLSANETVWRYDETKAMIYHAKIDPQGNIERSTEPLNKSEGRSPVISSGNGVVTIVWASTDQDIQCSSTFT